jgi:hypothetical protein
MIMLLSLLQLVNPTKLVHPMVHHCRHPVTITGAITGADTVPQDTYGLGREEAMRHFQTARQEVLQRLTAVEKRIVLS